MTTDQLKKWQSEFGDKYTERNEDAGPTIQQRMGLWNTILMHTIARVPDSILEVGANIGDNLVAIKNIFNHIDRNIELYAIEPNQKAKDKLQFSVLVGDASNIGAPNAQFDMVLTCGVLIHIHPNDLLTAMKEIYRVSKHYVVCIEYFNPKCEEIKYQGEDGLLWKNDFGSLWLDNFPLRCVGYGFSWKRMSGLDNLTWWIFEKVH